MDLIEQLENKLKDMDKRMKSLEKKQAARLLRQTRDEIRKDLGLVKVRGNLGGTYWE